MQGESSKARTHPQVGSSFCTLLARAQFALQTAQSNAVSLTGHAEDGFLLQVCGVFKDTNVNFHKEKCSYLLLLLFFWPLSTKELKRCFSLRTACMYTHRCTQIKACIQQNLGNKTAVASRKAVNNNVSLNAPYIRIKVNPLHTCTVPQC